MSNTYIVDIAAALANNHAALMVGAGFSKNADRLVATDRRFLDWNEMSDLFYDAVHDDKSDSAKKYSSSLRLAQEVEVISGRSKLEELLKEAVPDMDYGPSDLYVNLMKLPWVDVFTTNYDTLLERTADMVTSRRYNVVVTQEDLVGSNGAPRIIKLHGSFPSHRPFIITEEDYRIYPTKFAAFVNTVQQALLENVFCMIGFSCEDPNFIKWIGWIHDNLGRSSSQKIYMVSVNHMHEANCKLLHEQNIMVIDLESIWPEKNIPDRVAAFIAQLAMLVEQSRKQEREWGGVEKALQFHDKKSLDAQIAVLHQLNETYPGWIFLPWKMKKRVANVFGKFFDKTSFTKGKAQEQLDYMYEYVKFSDIAGRPLLPNDVNLFWKTLSCCEESGTIEKDKLQTVYLQLLRAFREQARWNDYDNCRSKIQESLLSYDDRQFLYACDWWQSFYRFRVDSLSENLEKWSLSKGDLYWPLIRASMYALLGEFTKAEGILMDNLARLRKSLFRSEKKEYLYSIEECCVSLINFIRSRNILAENVELEKCRHEDRESYPWWDENNWYCLNLNTEDRRSLTEEKIEYDLVQTTTSHFCANKENYFYALEYLRFIEQTGHPFRLASVTNIEGLKGTLERLSTEYPHWCFIHTLIAQNTKQLNYLYGRSQLAIKSQEEVDRVAAEYVQIMKILRNNVKTKNEYSQATFFEQAAAVLPSILARLCYKCSAKVLDEILDISLEICQSNALIKFNHMDKLTKGLVKSYTGEEQYERIDKLVMFPVCENRISQYKDPLVYVSMPRKKKELSTEIYNNVLFEIRKSIASGKSDQKESAINRLVILYQIIEFKEEDKSWLIKLLKNDAANGAELLCLLQEGNCVQNAKEVFDYAMVQLENDAKESQKYSSGRSPLDSLLSVVGYVNEQDIDFFKSFSVLRDSLDKNCKWATKNDFVDAETRIREIFALLVGLSSKKEKFSDTEMEVMQSAVTTLENYYCSSATHLFKADNEGDLEMTSEVEVERKMLWTSKTRDIDLLTDYYYALNEFSVSQNQYPVSKQFASMALEYSIFKMFGTCDEILISCMELCEVLLNTIQLENKNQLLLLSAMKQLIDDTVIKENDMEEVSINKLRCRIAACKIARTLYKKGVMDEVVLRWKEVSECNDEFSEIRRIRFMEDV